MELSNQSRALDAALSHLKHQFLRGARWNGRPLSYAAWIALSRCVLAEHTAPRTEAR